MSRVVFGAASIRIASREATSRIVPDVAGGLSCFKEVSEEVSEEASEKAWDEASEEAAEVGPDPAGILSWYPSEQARAYRRFDETIC